MAVRKGYVDVKDGQLHYREAGPESGVPIVFLHQTASSGAMWEQVISAFGERLQDIRPGYAGLRRIV